MTAAWVLAHQGGWDEILLVLTPVAMFAGLLWLANRRANAQLADRSEGDGEADGDPGAEGDPSPEVEDPPGGRSP